MPVLHWQSDRETDKNETGFTGRHCLMRILIVDENADFRTVLSEYLREGLAAAANSARKAKCEAPAGLAVKEWNPATQGIPLEGKGGF